LLISLENQQFATHTFCNSKRASEEEFSPSIRQPEASRERGGKTRSAISRLLNCRVSVYWSRGHLAFRKDATRSRSSPNDASTEKHVTRGTIL